MGILFNDWQEYIVGKENHDAIISFIFTAALVIVTIEYLRDFIGLKRAPNRRTLKLRKLKGKVTGEFLMSGTSHSNPFFLESNFRFNVMADKVDYLVMKLTAEDVPILAKQEHQHAKMHHMAMKAAPEETAWITSQWCDKVWDALMLRIPNWMGAAIALAFESVSPIQFYIAQFSPLSKGGQSNMMIFHGFEEIEHATVTVHYLREYCPFIVRLCFMPVMVLIAEVGLSIPFAGILCTFYAYPELLLKPRTYLFDIPQFLLNMLIMEYFATLWIIVHFLFQVPHYDAVIEHFYALLEEEVKSRGFEWDIVEEKTFVLDQSLHASARRKYSKFLDGSYYWSLVKPTVAWACTEAKEQLVQLRKALDFSVGSLLAPERKGSSIVNIRSKLS